MKEYLIGFFVTCILIVILFVSVFAGCYLWNSSHITEGVVVWKRFVPEHEESSTTYIHVGGENSTTIPITSWHTVPDKYTVGLQGTYNNKEYTRTIQVDRQSYVLIKEGQKLCITDLPLSPTAEEEQ